MSDESTLEGATAGCRVIDFKLELDGLARKLVDTSEEQLFSDGVKKAGQQARAEIETNFEVGGRPAWKLTEDGRVPLNVTGSLCRACTNDATVDEVDEGFELYATGSEAIVADVQDRRYGIFVLPDEAQEAVADALEEGMLED